jgi:hypothetical protein
MVLVDEYGEFEMLSIDVVKLAEDFDGWDELSVDEGWPTLRAVSSQVKSSNGSENVVNK